MIENVAITPDVIGTMSPVKLFMDADIVVKIVMIGLILASIWTWSIIFSFAIKLTNIRKKCENYEKDFWQSGDLQAFYKARGHERLPSAQLLAAGFGEWRRSVRGRITDREGVRQRLSTALDASVNSQIDKLSDRLNFLATVGAVAPFIGLFGTVWGIMRSFSAIAAEQNSSLATVAPDWQRHYLPLPSACSRRFRR